MASQAPVTRFLKNNPCPICGGGDNQPRGQGKRCSGYLSSDGRYAYCTREEHAGAAELQQTEPPSYRHLLEGNCYCGQTHGPERRSDAEATYDYRDAAGELIYQVVRLSGKRFRQRRPAPDDTWVWDLKGVQRLLYRLPEVLAAAAVGETIYIVEGEKDVHAVERSGAVATTNSGGAGKWQPQYALALQGADIIIVADSDEPGRAHAAAVAATLPDARLMTPAAGKDVSDHLAAGYPLADLLPLLLEAAPAELEPTAAGAYEDLDNAIRLIAEHGGALRYVDPWGRWLYWDPPAWREDTTCHTEALAQQNLLNLLAAAARIDDEKTRARALREIQAAKRASRLAGTLRAARARPGIPIAPAALDADEWTFNCQNGTIDLRTGALRPHNPEDLLTKSSPTNHDPDAEAPTWERFLARVLPDQAVREFLARATGYSMIGGNPAQILLILHGSGANGKSTFLEIIRALFGDYGQQAPPETFLAKHDGIPNDVARLRGARFVAATEIAEGRRLNEPLIKRMTGGDTMTARFMRQEYFEFQPQFTPWLATNHKPEIRGTDEAIWRRIRLVPFAITIPPAERDENLRPKLAAELPGILNWALAGAAAYQADGLAEPEIVRAATAEYREDQDLLGSFINDECRLGDTERALAGPLYNTYRDWAKGNGNDPGTAQSFGRKLSERGYTRTATRGGRAWIGLALNDSQEQLK